MARSTLSRHQKTRKCQSIGRTYVPPTPVRERVARETLELTPRNEPRCYSVSIPVGTAIDIPCPVSTCAFKVVAGRSAKCTAMRQHFAGRHLIDSITIREEGQLPRCQSCGLFAKSVNSTRHTNSQACLNLTEKRQRYFKQAAQQERSAMISFTVNGVEINKVYEFRYLGRMLDAGDDDSVAAERQLTRARARWGRVGKVLSSVGANARTMGFFYKAIVQAVLLYGSESWTLTEGTLQKLRSFHSRVARYICNKHIRQLEDGTWVHPSTEAVLEEAGLYTIDEYIRRRRVSVRRFVRGRPIFEACRRSQLLDSNRKRVVWWELPSSETDLQIPTLSSSSDLE